MMTRKITNSVWREEWCEAEMVSLGRLETRKITLWGLGTREPLHCRITLFRVILRDLISLS